jgi:hypothetical protein
VHNTHLKNQTQKTCMREKNQTSTQKQSFIKVDDQRKENPYEE